MTIETVVVPMDFSDSSTAALAYAKQLADAFGASVHLLHVIPDPAAHPWAAEAYSGSLSAILAELKADAQKNLEKALPAADRKRYRSTLTTAVGAPFSEIIDYVKKHDVDLIVMGTHGRGALAHAILGSVTERVVRFAPCPVLAVRVPAEKRKRAGRRTAASRR
jgi:nucleotide-binding universal stress UspA family protein